MIENPHQVCAKDGCIEIRIGKSNLTRCERCGTIKFKVFEK